jgi:Zn ribbon nucleic-acid-binding protein/DNA polymerase elongation subunit (family B)
MSKKELVNKLLKHPQCIGMGRTAIAQWLNVTPDEAYEAKLEATDIIKRIANDYLNTPDKQEVVKKHNTKLPKILIFDIETSPLEAYVWQKNMYNTNISQDRVISEWYILTWSCKWLFSNEVMSDRLTGDEAIDEDDSRIVKSLWKLFDEADMVIAHNADKFDIPNMNTRFILNGLKQPSPYQHIDTLKIARKEFGFTHNNLDALARVFGLKGKIETNFNLWRRCKRGEDAALIEMEKYNTQDVVLLEEVYLELRGWMKNHPSVALFIEDGGAVCPVCGSTHLVQKGHYYTQVSKFETYECQKCGGYSRNRKNIVPVDVRKNLMISLTK